VRALKIPRDPEPSQDDVLERWAARRRDLLLAARLDRLTAALERLVSVLERAA